MLKSVIKQAWKVGGIYLVWISLHYTSSNLYAKLCTPLSVAGFVTSPFLVASPHCFAFRWCIKHGADAISSMWVVLGTWFLSCLSWKKEDQK